MKKEEITIGDQVWMAENLSVDTFRNGDPIPHAETDEQWVDASENGQPAWCYYDNDPANGKKYGKLYYWHAVNDPPGLAPEGSRYPGYVHARKGVEGVGEMTTNIISEQISNV
jgi:uncharacterized protein (TIGR02145 family)